MVIILYLRKPKVGQIFCFSCSVMLRMTKYILHIRFKLCAHRNIIVSKNVSECYIKLKLSFVNTTVKGLNFLLSHYIVLIIIEGQLAIIHNKILI